ncbi:hypothetical protein [Arcobacter sp. YIC-80]|uniref:hypothetical protein n=1 Tax=unclassified Arcobacter TaxID=2593671 RepID=UPI00384C4DD2
MSGKELNISSVKTTKGDKLAAKGNQNKNATRVAFSQDKNQKEQIVNARKSTNGQLAKKKAKRKAAKASKKKSKK